MNVDYASDPNWARRSRASRTRSRRSPFPDAQVIRKATDLVSGWRFHHGNSVSDVDAPTLLVHRAVVRPAQGDQVVELGGTAVRPVDDVVAVGPRGRSVAPREAAALVAEVERGADGCRDRARGPSDRERLARVLPAVKAAPSAGGATVTTVRTASQAMRRAVSGWIGPTPRNSAAALGSRHRQRQRLRAHRDREMGPLPVHVAVVTAAQLRGGQVDQRVGTALRRRPGLARAIP